MSEPGKISIIISPRDTDPNTSGRPVPSESNSVTLAMDTIASGWTAVMPWTPGAEPALDSLTDPFSYAESAVYIDGEQVSQGRLYTMEPSRQADGRRQRTLTFYSYTADIIDGVWNKPFQYNNQSFLDIASIQGASYDVLVTLDPNASTEANRILPIVQAKLTDNMHDRLAKLAKEQGLLLRANRLGGLYVTKISPGGVSVGTIKESSDFFPGSTNSTEYKATYDGRELFARYAAIKSNRNQFQQFAVVFNDQNVPARRTERFEANSQSKGTLQESALWAASKGLADALTIPFPVQGWRNPSGSLWEPGTIVTVISETLSINRVDMLVRSATFKFDSQDGRRTELNLVPPEVYTGKRIPMDVFRR